MSEIGALKAEWTQNGMDLSQPINTKNPFVIGGIVKAGLRKAAQFFRDEAEKTMKRKISMANFKTPRGRSRKESKFHIRSGKDLIEIKEPRNSPTSIKIRLNTKSGVHWFETGSGTGHWSRTYSDRINPFSKKGRKIGRHRTKGAAYYNEVAGLHSVNKVRLTRKKTKNGKQRHTGRIEGLYFFREVRENTSIENQITQIINSHLEKELSKIL